MIASVSGRRMVKVEPSPSVEAWRVAVDLSRRERPSVGAGEHECVGVVPRVGGEVLPNVLDEVGR